RPLSTAETLTYLHSCVSERWHGVARLAILTDLDIQLCDTPFVGGWDPQLGSWHVRTCSVRGPRSRRRPLSGTQHHPTTSLVGISWHCKEPCKFMSSILTISVTTTHCIPIIYKRIFISMAYKNSKKIK